MNKYDLEERLIDFTVSTIEISKQLPKNDIGRHLSGQLVRSGTSPSLNYGEAQSAESRKDFIHKIKIILKELRESLICLKIIKRANLIKNTSLLENTMTECDELISIFVTSVKTAQENIDKGKK